MGGSCSSERGGQRRSGSGKHAHGIAEGGGRPETYGRNGKNWWVDPDENPHDHGLLAISKEEELPAHKRYRELQIMHAPTKVVVDTEIGTLQENNLKGVDIKLRMAELREAHEQRLIKMETEKSRLCCVCNETIEGERADFLGGIDYCHPGCHAKWEEQHAPVCVHCEKPIIKVEGKFSGQKMAWQGGFCHAECSEALIQASLEPCAHCAEKLVTKFYVCENGDKVHVECKAAHDSAMGFVCMECSKPFEVPAVDDVPASEEKDEISGMVAKRVKFAGGWCHSGECAKAYAIKRSPPCIHCGKPVRSGIDDDTTDLFVPLSDGIVHHECYDPYRAALCGTCGVCGEVLTGWDKYIVMSNEPLAQETRVHGACRDRWVDEHGDAAFKLATAAAHSQSSRELWLSADEHKGG